MKRSSLAATAVLLAAILAGCSAPSEPNADTPSPSVAPTQAPTTTPTPTLAPPAPSTDPQADFVAQMKAAFPDMQSATDENILALGNILCEADRSGDWASINADPTKPETAQSLAIAKQTLCP